MQVCRCYFFTGLPEMRVIFSCWRQWSSGWPFSQGASIDCAHSSEPLLTMPWASSGGISLEMPVCMHTREGGAYPPSLAPLSPRKDGH